MVTDPENSSAIEIIHHGDVFRTFAKRRLVYPDKARPLFLSSSQSSANRPILDPSHLVPTERKLAGHGREARLLQPVDDERFEEGCEPRLWIRPRDPDLDDAVLLTLHPRNVGHEKRSVLHGVQMTPASLAGVVARASALTRRAV